MLPKRLSEPWNPPLQYFISERALRGQNVGGLFEEAERRRGQASESCVEKVGVITVHPAAGDVRSRLHFTGAGGPATELFRLEGM